MGEPAAKVADRASKLLVLGCAAAALAFALLVGLFRYMDRDEGGYAMASDMAARGLFPIRDFFYPQGPAAPILLSFCGGDVRLMRAAAAALVALVAALLARIALARSSPLGAVYTVLAFLTCWYVPVWMTTAKLYAFASAPSLGAAVLVMASRTSVGRGRLLRLSAAGGLIGLAAAIRLPALVLLVAFSVWILAGETRREGVVRDVLAMLSCAALICAAALLLTGATPEQLYRNLIWFHASRPDPSGQRINVVQTWLRDPQVLALIGAAIWSVRRTWQGFRSSIGQDHLLGTGCGALLTLGYLLARPTYDQYFTYAVPFWVWGATPAFAALAQRTSGTFRHVVLGMASWVALFLFIYSDHLFRSPYPHQTYFALDQVQAVKRALRERLPPETEVLSYWPGYVAGTGLRPTRGLEFSHALDAAATLDGSTLERLGLISPVTFQRRAYEGHAPAVVVSREDVTTRVLDPRRLSARYRIAWKSADVSLFIRVPDSSPP